MNKIFIVFFAFCLLFNSCTSNKIYTRLYQLENKKTYKNPLIVIPVDGITKNSSEKIKKKFEELLLEKNIKSTIYLHEVKSQELKLNQKEVTIFEELAPIYDSNKNDVFILFKYNEYNYGYGISFIQSVFVIDNSKSTDKEKVIWSSKGYATNEGINKYCSKIVEKLILDGVL